MIEFSITGTYENTERWAREIRQSYPACDIQELVTLTDGQEISGEPDPAAKVRRVLWVREDNEG